MLMHVSLTLQHNVAMFGRCDLKLFEEQIKQRFQLLEGCSIPKGVLTTPSGSAVRQRLSHEDLEQRIPLRVSLFRDHPKKDGLFLHRDGDQLQTI